MFKKDIIANKTFDSERALYALRNVKVENCVFSGPSDGESPLKECEKITVSGCNFDLRYPLWHCANGKISKTNLSELCRAALWYCKGISVLDSNLLGIKAFRECKDIKLENCKVVSPEFGWRCKKLNLKDSDFISEYFLFESKDIVAENIKMQGKYSFQYTKNVTIENSFLDTKDAFWHAENVTVKKSVVKGEYLAWYSKNLTFIDCEIIGTQPLCYCDNLKLINCKMTDCDRSFEYSEVDADIVGTIISVENPGKGRIIADGIGEVINSDAVYETNCEILIRAK